MMIRQSDQSANISASLLSAPSHVPVGLNNKHPPVSDSFYGNSELFPVKDYKPESEFPCDAGYGFFSFIFMCLAGNEKKKTKNNSSSFQLNSCQISFSVYQKNSTSVATDMVKSLHSQVKFCIKTDPDFFSR